MAHIGESIAAFLFKQGIIENDMQEICTYGLELLIFMQWIQKINNYNLILWCGLIASYIYVIYNAPIENHNKPLNQCQINKNRKSSKLR